MSEACVCKYYGHMATCSVTDCPKPNHAHRLCNGHLQRWKASGVWPTTPLEPRKQKVTGYHGIHHRVRKARGRAKDQLCPCGAPATMWAYNHQDPEEIQSDLGPYSLDIMNYVAMCTPCHRKLDEVDYQELGRSRWANV